MSAPALRDYQVLAVESVESAWRSGARRTLIESATGTGKTTTFTEVARREADRGGRTLVMAHRRELVDQAADRLRDAELSVTVERGRTLATGSEQVVCASVQTMAARLDRFSPEEFTLVVVDEAHHSPSPAHRWVLAHFPDARVLGVTATTDRADGISLATVFDSCAARYGIAEAIAAGHLVPARGIVVEVPGMDLSKVRQRVVSTKGERDVVDLHPGDLGRAAIAPEAVEGITGPLVELAGARRTIVFAVDRRHAYAITASLRARGRTAAWVDSTLCPSERKGVLEAHRESVVQYLVNVGILCEGFDDPRIECVAMCRPTTSRILFVQCAGRGLRLCPEIKKSECLVLDFAGVSCQHDLVGPEDALAGAMIVPVTHIGSSTSSAPAKIVEYVPPASWRSRFSSRVVELVRGGRKVAKKVAGRVTKIVRALVG